MPDNKYTFRPLPGYPNIKALLVILNALELFKTFYKNTPFTYSNFMAFFTSRVNPESTESNTPHALAAPRPNQEYHAPTKYANHYLNGIASEISDTHLEACREYLYSPDKNEPSELGKYLKVICRKFKRDADTTSLLKKLFELHDACNLTGEYTSPALKDASSSALKDALEKYTFIHHNIMARGATALANGRGFGPPPNSVIPDNAIFPRAISPREKHLSKIEKYLNEISEEKFKEKFAKEANKIFYEKIFVDVEIDFNAAFRDQYYNIFNKEMRSAFTDLLEKHVQEKRQADAQAAADTTTTAAPSDNGEQLSARAAMTQNETSAVPVADGDTEPTSHAMPPPIAGAGADALTDHRRQGALSDAVPSTQARAAKKMKAGAEAKMKARAQVQAEATKPTNTMSTAEVNANPATKPVFPPLYRLRPAFEQEDEEQQIAENLRHEAPRALRASEAYWEHTKTADHAFTYQDWDWGSETEKEYWRMERELAEFFDTQANAEAEVETTTTTTTTTTAALSGSSEQDAPLVNPMEEAGPQENPQPASALPVPAVNPPSLEQVPAGNGATDADAVQKNDLVDQEPDGTTDGLQRAPSAGDADPSLTATPPIVPSTSSASSEWNATLVTGAPPGTNSDAEPISHTLPLLIAGAGAGAGALLYAWFGDYTPDQLLADVVASISSYDASL